MVMLPVQKVSAGWKIELKNDVWSVVEYQHHKPGKGGAIVRLKIKSMTTGRVLEETYPASASVEVTEVVYRKMAYLYKDGDDYVFMDNQTYEQTTIPAGVIGDRARFLLENLECTVVAWNDKVIGVDMPSKVDMKVVDTYSAQRGDTATNVTKDATLESGYVAQVPLFINRGDVVRIDTRDGSYESRVSNG